MWRRVDEGGDGPCQRTSFEKPSEHSWISHGDPAYRWCFNCGAGHPDNREVVEYDDETNAMRINVREERI